MNMTFLIAAVAGLGFSIWIVRKSRGPIRRLILRRMSVDQRISPKGLELQNKHSMKASAILTALLSILLTLGFLYLHRLASSKIGNKTKAMSKTSIQASNPNKTNTSIPPPFEEISVQPPTKLSTTPLDTLRVKIPEQTLQKEAAKVPESAPTLLPKGNWYVQIHALSTATAARSALASLGPKYQIGLHLFFLPEESPPYKVVLGPFPNRQAAKNYHRKYAPGAWPREISSKHRIE